MPHACPPRGSTDRVVARCAATYRRPEGLGRLLDGLAALGQSGAIEPIVVIVDNSADSEARVQVAAAAERFPWPLHYVAEPRRGITFARNAALDTAAATACAFGPFIADDQAIGRPPCRASVCQCV